MATLIVYLFIIILTIISIIIKINNNKRKIDLFKENAIDKFKKYNYQLLKIKRKRQPQRYGGCDVLPSYECPLETEIPVHWFPPEDNIEVYGIENNNKYLIFTRGWSKENVQKIKNIVEKINEQLTENA